MTVERIGQEKESGSERQDARKRRGGGRIYTLNAHLESLLLLLLLLHGGLCAAHN